MKERAELVAKLVERKIGRKTSIAEVLKNNKKVYGITIETEQKSVCANIYIDGMYYLENEKIADMVIAAFEESKTPKFDVERLSTKEYILDHVIPCVIGKRGNQELLAKNANVQFLDLAYTLRVMIPGEGSYLLTNDMVEKIGSNVPELFRRARENMVRDYKTKIIPIENAVASILGQCEESDKDIPDEECGMAVLTNTEKLYGANGFLRKDLLKKYAERIGKDLYILPSSVHELLVVPKGSVDVEQLREMVREVNDNEVDDVDILSYTVYEYNRVLDNISVAS